MSSVNRVFLIGRVGKDPEVRYMQNGTAVVNFSVATSESWKDKNSGEKKENTQWHRIVAFRRLAEICAEYLTKGQLIFLEGKSQTREYEDKNGIKRQTTEVIVHNMQMLGGGKRADHAPPATEPDDVPF